MSDSDPASRYNARIALVQPLPADKYRAERFPGEADMSPAGDADDDAGGGIEPGTPTHAIA